MKNPRMIFAVTSGRTAMAFLPGYLSFINKAGWQVSLVSSMADGIEEFAKMEGVDFIHVPLARKPSLKSDLSNLMRIYSQLCSKRPDVVVAATPKAALLTLFAARLARVPRRIYLLWGLRFETTSRFARWLLKAMEWLAMNCATQVLSNSQSLRNAAIASKIVSPSKITTVGSGSSHGVDLERYSADAKDIPPLPSHVKEFVDANRNSLIVVFIGRIHPDKGIDILLNAMRILRAANKKISLIIVGRQESSDLVSDINRAVAEGHTKYIGEVQDVRPYLLAAHALCLPSLREGLPNVVLEAGSMGRPSIVSDATGAVDSVIHGKTGFVVRAGDSYALAFGLLQLIEDPDVVLTLGRSARQWVENEFEQAAVWQSYVQHFINGK